MTIVKIGMNGVLPDNDVQYITYITKVIHKTDKEAEVTIIKGIRTHSYNIKPSDPGLKSQLVDALTLANGVIGVRIEFSKSMKISNSIYFELL